MKTAEIIDYLETANRHRGWISNSYAQVEFLLGDLIARCRSCNEYDEHTRTVSHSAGQRIAKVRAMLAIDGPLNPYRVSLGAILDTFSQYQQVRNLLAHGYCEFHYTPTGDAGLVFRKFDRDAAKETGRDDAQIMRLFRMADLERERDLMIEQAQSACELFHHIHHYMGWAGSDPSSFLPIPDDPENAGA